MVNTNESLANMVDNAIQGSCIEVEDLTTCCENINELTKIAYEACRKMISLRSVKQPWVNSHNQGENQIITLVKLSQLQRNIEKYQQTHNVNDK